MIDNVTKKRIKDLRIIELLTKMLKENNDISEKYYFFLLILSTIKVESGFVATAKNPRTSATGLAQIVRKTFEGLKKLYPETADYDLTNPEHAIYLCIKLYVYNLKFIDNYYLKLKPENQVIVEDMFGQTAPFESKLKYLVYTYLLGIGSFKKSADKFIKETKENNLQKEDEDEKKDVTFNFIGTFNVYWGRFEIAYNDFKDEYPAIPELEVNEDDDDEDDDDEDIDLENIENVTSNDEIEKSEIKKIINTLPVEAKEKLINKMKKDPDTLDKLSDSEKVKFNKLKKLQYGEGFSRKYQNKLLNEYMILKIINKILL